MLQIRTAQYIPLVGYGGYSHFIWVVLVVAVQWLRSDSSQNCSKFQTNNKQTNKLY